ncbi:hypothetical protein BOSE62_40281 [Bosea sp. 62]|nr:hypothetical protein BOSE46_120507 [Bosea sp. 46]CAD5262866.1 hypothetical protein BOSE21B_110737 [Bosea sp. 21B]CAD5277532.1 hypothetical protein BOSE7B_40481 [Bosea sp. 7B]VVT58840.1 hypothetical protein BOS5A_200786 [Bosea sp. EC-HK365B]VXB61428.1 hypothetical protein BOSE29B_110670 [Bosea sp. 29B]VXC02650.1 hypothetical protein BOSE125_160463 [Bosea sp. 125]VXC38329.1 hypothetical protein BOSE62_40281 [Bosea sp. 62]VXC79438.1 hypothetical protein BOSE127_50187 [Bosea sp. 127]
MPSRDDGSATVSLILTFGGNPIGLLRESGGL